MSSQKLIYLASPYSHDDPNVIERRVRQVQAAAARLIELGHLIFSPIVHSHPIADIVTFAPVNTADALSGWMEYDRAMIDKADELWVLELDGWAISRGVEAEMNHALNTGKTIRHIEYPSLKEIGHVRLAHFDYTDGEGEDGRVIQKLSQFVGAGKFYSPASSGKPKFFEDQTHTAYAVGDKVRIIADGAEDDPHCRIRGSVGVITQAAQVRVGDDRARYKVHINDEDYYGDWAVLPTDIEPFNNPCPSEFDQPHGCTPDCYGLKAQDEEPAPKRDVSLPDDAGARNGYPMADGLLYYFPNALAEVSKISRIGNEQHNPGEDMHWSRGKSTDHANKIIRHLIDAGKTDDKGNRHSALVAWRALALLQEELEAAYDLPLPKNARHDNE